MITPGLPASKAEAEQIGSALYMTGTPCKNGHIAPRRTANRLCVECGKEQCRRWYERNPNLAYIRGREWKKTYPEKARASGKLFRQKNRLTLNLRGRLIEIRKRSGVSIDVSAAINFLGCSLDELRDHIESQFQQGMTWDNWGRQGWHMDHIKPLLHFDLEDETQLRLACHYTNLQPLWWRDNILKGHVERGNTIHHARDRR
jgi:hypothetical protein